MRCLKENETKIVYDKLAKFVGDDLMKLVDNKEDPHVFRLIRERVYYVPANVVKYANAIPRKQLISTGTCVGKLSKTGKFRIHITFLNWLAKYTPGKVWLKPAGEQAFLYGNQVIKRHLGRVVEDVEKNQCVVIYSMSDIPLGFGVTAKSCGEMRTSDTEAIVVFRHADIGEYLRDEADII